MDTPTLPKRPASSALHPNGEPKKQKTFSLGEYTKRQDDRRASHIGEVSTSSNASPINSRRSSMSNRGQSEPNKDPVPATKSAASSVRSSTPMKPPPSLPTGPRSISAAAYIEDQQVSMRGLIVSNDIEQKLALSRKQASDRKTVIDKSEKPAKATLDAYQKAIKEISDYESTLQQNKEAAQKASDKQEQTLMPIFDLQNKVQKHDDEIDRLFIWKGNAREELERLSKNSGGQGDFQEEFDDFDRRHVALRKQTNNRFDEVEKTQTRHGEKLAVLDKNHMNVFKRLDRYETKLNELGQTTARLNRENVFSRVDGLQTKQEELLKTNAKFQHELTVHRGIQSQNAKQQNNFTVLEEEFDAIKLKTLALEQQLSKEFGEDVETLNEKTKILQEQLDMLSKDHYSLSHKHGVLSQKQIELGQKHGALAMKHNTLDQRHNNLERNAGFRPNNTPQPPQDLTFHQAKINDTITLLQKDVAKIHKELELHSTLAEEVKAQSEGLEGKNDFREKNVA
ncbi:hypothetical protein BT63DRAFT_384199 [Microthyrium microscopicum]|uniref:Uncharacterized protein n=1 Tax=Microthyrium microscopicum TaxID=703497 RepID=A0A6A6UH92_9PEZI|nr:hypothetical protein BT63DRAFT_384199 [Microthyrium microscopicum]